MFMFFLFFCRFSGALHLQHHAVLYSSTRFALEYFNLASEAGEHHCNRDSMEVAGNGTQTVFLTALCILVFYLSLSRSVCVSLGEGSTNILLRYHFGVIFAEDMFLLLRYWSCQMSAAYSFPPKGLDTG